MAYAAPNSSREVTFKEYLCESKALIDLMEKIDDDFKRYMELMLKVRTWQPFFFPTVTITEVNNDNMGHIYLGKVRVPMNFNRRDAFGKPETKILTFVVCKFDEYPGEENLEIRKKIAFEKAKKRLASTYPERYTNSLNGENDCNENEDFDSINANLARIDAFLTKHGMSSSMGK